LISLAASPAALCLTRIIRGEAFTYLLQHSQQVIGLLRIASCRLHGSGFVLSSRLQTAINKCRVPFTPAVKQAGSVKKVDTLKKIYFYNNINLLGNIRRYMLIFCKNDLQFSISLRKAVFI
jgi:hypothetical protein